MIYTAMEYIQQLEGKRREIANHLHLLLMENTDLLSILKYKIPFYSSKSNVCYLNPINNDGIELCFIRGYQLSDVQKMLRHNGRKQIRGISFYSVDEIETKSILEIVNEAVILDEIYFRAKKKR